MKKLTHQFVSAGFFFFVSVLFQLPTFGIIFGTIVSFWVGLFNDIIDFKLLGGFHRNWFTHSPISPLAFLVFFLFWVIGDFIFQPLHSLIFAGLMGVLIELHILLDLFNVTGVPLIPKKTINLKQIPFDDFKLNFLWKTIGFVFFIMGLIFIQ